MKPNTPVFSWGEYAKQRELEEHARQIRELKKLQEEERRLAWVAFLCFIGGLILSIFTIFGVVL